LAITLLARGLLLSVKYREYQLLEVVSKAVDEMSQGELLQIEKARKLNINEEVYFKIIEQKTAALNCGLRKSWSTFGSSKSRRQLRIWKSLVCAWVLAFQIKDDLFDYEPNGLSGKPSGNDIKEKKMTLPLIHVKDKLSAAERRKILRLLKKKHKTKKRYLVSSLLLKNMAELIMQEKKWNHTSKKALDILDKYPDSPTKTL
jgi:octaprenyl-diphosphate synthase